jgi:hypothetical protein
MADSDRILPERLIGPDGLLLRRWLPEDADALSAAIAEAASTCDRGWLGLPASR